MANSTSNTHPFQWTDELVLKYHEFRLKQPPLYSVNPEEVLMSRFKASHSSVGEGRDWEIFELKDGTEFSALVDGDYWLKKQAVKITAKGISDAGMIKSVRRLSDGEVFSVGDDVGWDLSQVPGNNKNLFRITSFEINKLYPAKDRIFCNNQNIDICYLKKAPIPEPKKPLFTTEDGKDVFKGDAYWIVLEPEYNYEIVKCTCGDIGISIDRPGVHHFSTEQAAQEYILINKPVFNQREVQEFLMMMGKVPSSYIADKLMESAKSKITNTGGDK